MTELLSLRACWAARRSNRHVMRNKNQKLLEKMKRRHLRRLKNTEKLLKIFDEEIK
jgi:hypothetical protein